MRSYSLRETNSMQCQTERANKRHNFFFISFHTFVSLFFCMMLVFLSRLFLLFSCKTSLGRPTGALIWSFMVLFFLDFDTAFSMVALVAFVFNMLNNYQLLQLKNMSQFRNLGVFELHSLIFTSRPLNHSFSVYGLFDWPNDF